MLSLDISLLIDSSVAMPRPVNGTYAVAAGPIPAGTYLMVTATEMVGPYTQAGALVALKSTRTVQYLDARGNSVLDEAYVCTAAGATPAFALRQQLSHFYDGGGPGLTLRLALWSRSRARARCSISMPAEIPSWMKLTSALRLAPRQPSLCSNNSATYRFRKVINSLPSGRG